MLSSKMRREEVGLFDEGQSGGRDSLTLKVLETPSHSPKTTMGLSLRSPSMTSIASMGSLSTPASSIFGEGSSVKVRVSVPDELPATGPVFFEVEVRSAALRKIIVVQRRFKAFDALASKLQWDRIAIGAPDLPPKLPAPGYDYMALKARASTLQLWASFVLAQSDALKHPDVAVFFGLPADLEPDQLEEAEAALVKLQAMSRGYLARSDLTTANLARHSNPPKRGGLLRGVLVLSVLMMALGLGLRLEALKTAPWTLAPVVLLHAPPKSKDAPQTAS
ncbi:hypothetical protein Ctob_004207 [Chrysochromulina tobinii]|uniref:PX domain-containing protein n=1 Tax=Chrysochromulina tobinii TaxID=1460289 RepID=A0A0M0JUT3_9EUKA|nr:hypothetical protein Ctob_004207 [Chrysochromulina tobinii]|eukprot:KOO30087.1 hypothetical protein Ctob_004207 [Chrysochromulina sp. CCMP291]